MGSVAAKIAIQVSGGGFDDPSRTRYFALDQMQRLSEFMGKLGYNPRAIPAGNSIALALQATINDCTVDMIPVNPTGWDDNSLMQTPEYKGQINYVTRLGLTSELPLLYATFDLYWTYILNALGFRRSEAIVIAILPQSACNVAAAPWRSLY